MAVETETIRNVCLIGHRGSGKTSIAEGMIGLASGRERPGERRPRLHRRGDRAGHDAGHERRQPRVEGAPGQCARHPRRRGLRRGRLHSPEGGRLRDPGGPRPGPDPGRHGARVAQGGEGGHPPRHRRQPPGQGAHGLRGRGRGAQRPLRAGRRPAQPAYRTARTTSRASTGSSPGPPSWTASRRQRSPRAWKTR